MADRNPDKNARSRERQRRLHEARSNYRKQRDELAKSGFNSTKMRRELKRRYSEARRSIKESSDANQVRVNDQIQKDGVDRLASGESVEAEQETELPTGIEIIWADQSITFLSEDEDILSDYNNSNFWSIVFSVNLGSFDKYNITYDSEEEIFETTGTPPVQTKYRFRVVTSPPGGSLGPTSISTYGQYREVTICVNGEPRQILMKVT